MTMFYFFYIVVPLNFIISQLFLYCHWILESDPFQFKSLWVLFSEMPYRSVRGPFSCEMMKLSGTTIQKK